MMEKDAVIAFGKYDWEVLDNQPGKRLIIARDILDLRWYHTAFVEITWSDCEIRRYLNGTFYQSFTDEEKARMVPTLNRNPDNPWFGTKGGIDTLDNIFLLSLEEASAYFGDSLPALRDKGARKWAIDDEHNCQRQAKFQGNFHWWRLRSPGYYARTSAGIGANGNIYVRGNGVYGRPKDGGGLRPALWLKWIDR